MLHVYENHLGGYYTTYEIQTYEETHCETCGDNDWYLGAVETEDEARKLYEDYTKDPF